MRGGTAIAADAEAETCVKQFERFSCDYNSNVTVGNGSRSDNYFQVAGDLSPKADPTGSGRGNVLAYWHAWYGLGLVPLGYDFSTHNSVGNSIPVQHGETYAVNFDYYIDGTIGGSDIKIGLAVGKAHYTEAGSKFGDGLSQGSFNDKVSQITEELVFKSGTNPNTGWQNYTAYITIDDNAELSKYNELLLYARTGNGGAVYFDNVSVKSLASYELLSSEDYNSTPRVDSLWDGLYDNNGDILILPDPNDANNTLISYRQGRSRLGIIRLGNNYKNKADKTAITVEAGKTYIIDFDYKIVGTNIPKDIEIGVAASKDTLDWSNYSTSAMSCVKGGGLYRSLVVQPASSAYESDGKFKHYTATLSIPQSADVSEYNKLVLYMMEGGGGGDYQACIDNVSVYGAAVATAYFEDKTLFESGYDNAVQVGGSRSDYFYLTSGDLSPAKESGNESNTVLHYRQAWYGLGTVVLGNSYTAHNNYSNAITVKNGVGYAVTFDYKIFGETKSSALNIGLAVGKPNYWADGASINGQGITEQSAVYKDFITVAAQTETDGAWHRGYTAYITVPEDADLSVYNTLLLYARYGNQEGNSGVYFDNISVKALAGVTAVFTEGDKTTEIYYADGMIKDYQSVNENNETAIWYYDTELTQRFSEENYQRSGKYESIPLYCKWNVVYKINYYLNRYCAGKTAVTDGIEITSELEADLKAPAELIAEYYGADYPTDAMTFDGWYTIKKVGSDYYFDKRVETVEEAYAAGCNVYARWSYKEDKSYSFDVNEQYSKNLYSGSWAVEMLDGEYRIKRQNDVFSTAKAVLMLADSNDQSEYPVYIDKQRYMQLNFGSAYKVTFKYKVTEVDPEAPINIHLYSSLISEYWNDGYKTSLVDIVKIDETNEDWRELTTYFVADNLRMSPANESSNWYLRTAGRFADALSILTFGVGTIYFDDFEVTALSPESYNAVLSGDRVAFDIELESNAGIVNIDSKGNFFYDRAAQSLTLECDGLEPAVGSLKLNGERIYKNPDIYSGSFKGNDTGREFFAPLGSEKASISAEIKDFSSESSGINFGITAAETKADGNLRFILRNYSDDDNRAFFNGAEYDISERGVLLKRSQRPISDYSDLLCGSEGVSRVICENGAYNSAEAFSDYTVSINGIKEKHMNTYLQIRGYMVLTDGVNTFTVYTSNAFNGTVKEIGEGKVNEFNIGSITDGDVTLAQSDISSVTLTFYDADKNGITYGFAWQTLSAYTSPVLELSESRSFENAQTAQATVTPYTRYYKTDGDYNSYSVEKEDSVAGYMTAYTVYANKAQMGSLKANTDYYYRVGENGRYSMIGHFKTPDGNKDKFSFLFLADTQQFYSDINEYGITAEKAFAGRNYDFAVIDGDLVNYGAHEKQWTDLISGNRKYFSDIPVLPAAGNHEYNLSGTQAKTPECFYSHFNIKADHVTAVEGNAHSGKHTGIYYSYDYKNTHFVVLNTNEIYVFGGKLGDAQYNWLISDLEAANADEDIKNIIVYMHNGIYTPGEYGSNQNKNRLTLSLREQLQSVFAEQGVDLVLQAHDHIYARTKPLDKDGNVTESGGVIYMSSLPAGNQAARTLWNNEGDDYSNNIDKYESSVTAYKYDHAWTEVSVEGNAITVSTYATKVNTGADKILIDSFTVIS